MHRGLVSQAIEANVHGTKNTLQFISVGDDEFCTVFYCVYLLSKTGNFCCG